MTPAQHTMLEHLFSGDRGGATGPFNVLLRNPEMGDLVRKYIALDGYVRHYLPIRGFETMRDTLRHYRIADAPSFRLVHNAVHELMVQARSPQDSVASTARGPDDLASLCRRACSALPARLRTIPSTWTTWP